MLMKLYARFGIDDFTDFSTLKSEDHPMMSDLYDLVEKEFYAFDKSKKQLYTEKFYRTSVWGYTVCVKERKANTSMDTPTSKTASLSVSE